MDSRTTETWYGTFTGGAIYRIRNTISRLPLLGTIEPNLLVFASDPKLSAQDAIVVPIPDAAKYFRNWNDYLTVTGVAEKWGGEYVVETNGQWRTTKPLEINNYCQGQNIEVEVCLPLDVNAFVGRVYSRPLDKETRFIPAYVSNDSRQVTIDYCLTTDGGGATTRIGSTLYMTTVGCGAAIRKGDAIYFDDTDIDLANPATIVNVARGSDIDNKNKIVLTLDRAVTGIRSAIINRSARVVATTYIQPAAELTFRQRGDWEIEAVLDSAISSSPSFPSGRPTSQGQVYSFTISGNIPGRDFIHGSLILN